MRRHQPHTQRWPRNPALTLPFVRKATKAERRAGKPGLNFWSVTPTGHYLTDNIAGATMAIQALRYMAAHDSPHIVQWAILDMIANGPRRSGIEVGFLTVIGRREMLEEMLAGGDKKCLLP